MKYIFYQPVYSVALLNQEKFKKLTSNIKNLDKNLEFFNYHDDYWSRKPIYFSLFMDDYFIGVCKLDLLNDREKEIWDADYIISYVNIEKLHREKKLTRILIEYIMDWLKEKNLSLCTTSWTPDGNKKLRPLVKSIAKEKSVIFYDRKY